MLLVYIGLLFILLCITHMRYRNIINLNTIFNLMWCMCVGISTLGLYGLRKPTINTHIYILIGMLSFNIIFFAICKRNKKIDYKSIETKINQVNEKLVIYITLIGWIITVPIFIEVLPIMMEHGISYSRSYTFNGFFDSMMIQFLAKTIVPGIFDAIIIISIVNYVVEGKMKLVTVLSIGSAVLYTITYGGRYSLLKAIVVYICALIIAKRKIINKKKRKNKKLLIIAFIAVILITTLLREETSSLIKSIILYFVGPFSFFDLIVNNPGTYGLNSYLLFGAMTFGLVVEPIVLALKLFLGLNIDVPSYHFNIYAQKFADIGATDVIMYNANTTPLYHFMRDFGYIGPIIGMSILGGICAWLSNKYNTKQEIRYFYLIIFMATVLVDSVMTYQLMKVASLITILVIYVCTRQKR